MLDAVPLSHKPSPQACHEAFLVSYGQFMLPEAQHPPADLAQGFRHGSIASLIPSDFGIPELLAGLRPAKVLGAAMPEAAIDEDGESFSPKDEVGPHGLGVFLVPRFKFGVLPPRNSGLET